MGGLKNFLYVLHHYERLVNPVSMRVGKFLWVIGQVNLGVPFVCLFFHTTDTQVSRMNYVLAGHLIQFVCKKNLLGRGCFNFFFWNNRIQSSSFVLKSMYQWAFIVLEIILFLICIPWFHCLPKEWEDLHISNDDWLVFVRFFLFYLPPISHGH